MSLIDGTAQPAYLKVRRDLRNKIFEIVLTQTGKAVVFEVGVDVMDAKRVELVRCAVVFDALADVISEFMRESVLPENWRKGVEVLARNILDGTRYLDEMYGPGTGDD